MENIREEGEGIFPWISEGIKGGKQLFMSRMKQLQEVPKKNCDLEDDLETFNRLFRENKKFFIKTIIWKYSLIIIEIYWIV